MYLRALIHTYIQISNNTNAQAIDRSMRFCEAHRYIPDIPENRIGFTNTTNVDGNTDLEKNTDKVTRIISMNECTICLADAIDNRKNLPCGHGFCEECIDQWIKDKTTCPICRESVTRV